MLSSICQYVVRLIPGATTASEMANGVIRVLVGGVARDATGAEILAATKIARVEAINAECRARLSTRYGQAEEQVSRALGVYGTTERAAMETGIAATIDASNVASDAVDAALTGAAVEAVTVAWPVI